MQHRERGVIGHREPADAGQRLRERTDHEVDPIQHALRLGASQSARPERPERMRLVDEKICTRVPACVDDSASGAMSPLIE